VRKLKLALLFGATLAVAMAPAVAHAAPSYLTSQPEKGTELSEPPEEVRIVFNQPLDLDGDLIVADECLRRIDDGNVVIAGNTITVGIAKTPSGVYSAAWRVAAPAGVGGGDATGKIEFTVTSGQRCGPAARSGNEGHEGHGGSQNGDGHEEHDGSGGGHGGDHSDGGGSSSEHAGHLSTQASGAPDHAHSDATHEKNGAQAKGGNGRGGSKVVAAPRFASPLGDLVEPVSGSTVLAALLVSLGLGLAGGWMIRTMNV